MDDGGGGSVQVVHAAGHVVGDAQPHGPGQVCRGRTGRAEGGRGVSP